MIKIKAAFAMGVEGQFGKGDAFPWGPKPLKRDMQEFKAFTDDCILVMGKDTFKSLPGLLRGLDHIVISKDVDVVCKNGESPDFVVNLDGHGVTLEGFLRGLKLTAPKDVCVIGGVRMIDESLPVVDEVMVTTVYGDFYADRFLLPNTIQWLYNADFQVCNTGCYTEGDISAFTSYYR